MHADALVVAGIVEVDTNPDERLFGALLETRLRLDPLPVPHVGAMHDLDTAERPVLQQLDPLVDRCVDEKIPGRRRVVVTVTRVAAANDPGELGYLGRRGCLGGSSADTQRTNARPAGRRRGPGSDERACLASDDAQGQLPDGGRDLG